MCQFGDSTKILKELNLSEAKALIGWRNNHITNPFNNQEKHLKSLHQDYLWPKYKPAEGNPQLEDSAGVYNYNYNYDYNNYNHNNYDYYNHNYYDYNNYNNYNYYNIQVRTKVFGKVFVYEKGYRSSLCKVDALVILDRDSQWFTDEKTKLFSEHFNKTLEALAKEYNCDVVEYSKR